MQYRILLAALIVGIGWVYTFVTYGFPKDWSKRSGIACPLVRMAAFLLLAGLIINPGFSWIRRIESKSPVYIVDASTSMGITDTNKRSRFQRAVSFFPGETIVAAGDSIVVLSTNKGTATFPNVPRTDLGDMIQQAVSRRLEDRRFIFASDGIHNTGRDPVQTVRLLSREISCVFIDDSGEPVDARIDYVSMPSLILPQQKFTIETSVAYSGADSSMSTTARLILDGLEASTLPLILFPDSSVTFSFPVSLDQPGSSQVAVYIDSLPGERILENNIVDRSVVVRQRYRSCEMFFTRLLHDGAFLYQALQTDGGFSVFRSMRPLNITKSLGDSIPEVFILGIFDNEPIQSEYERAEKVLKGGGVLILLGWPQENPWSSLSPLWCTGLSADDGTIQPALQIGQSVSLLFGLNDRSRRPPQRIPSGSIQVSSRAEIVAESNGTPIIAVQPRYSGHVLTWLGSDWWRMLLKNNGTSFVDWPGIIRWLLTPEDKGRLRIHTRSKPLESGLPLVIRLEAFSRGMQPMVVGNAVVYIKSPTDSVYSYKRIRFSGTGPVAVQFPPVPAGNWKLSATAVLEGADTLQVEKAIRIQDSSREFINTVPDERILKRLAAETGGVFMSLEDSTRLDSLFHWDNDEFETAFVRIRAFWPAFILFVILLAVEWWLRHRQGLP